MSYNYEKLFIEFIEHKTSINECVKNILQIIISKK